MATEIIEPVWNDELIKRKKGATNFVTCGWCEHAEGDVVKYNCHIEGYCSLLKINIPRVSYVTPCIIARLGRNDVLDIVEYKKKTVKGYKDSIDELNKAIGFLNQMISKKPQKGAPRIDDCPAQPNNRKESHFNVGDKAMYWSPERMSWNEAQVVYGLNHHAGAVTFHQPGGFCVCGGKDKPAEGVYLKDSETITDPKMKKEMQAIEKRIGKLARCNMVGYAIPAIMLKKEYDWFVKNKDRWFDWIQQACSRMFNGKILRWEAITPPFMWEKEHAKK